MNAYSRLVGSSKRVPAQHFADDGAVAFGARGLAGLREAIPKIQAMGYPQAAAAPAAPAPSARSTEALKAMIPRMESMGYQQAGAAPPQYFAEGGLVKRLQQLVGMDPERNAKIAAYKAQSAAERLAGAPPPPTPAPAPAISGYSGMSAAQRREKEAGLKNGGHVRGPGSGTSDSIPARLSDGEFVLPADTVRKVGVSALERLVSDTHKPVKGGGKAGHFADGGLTSPRRFNSDLSGWTAQMEQQRAIDRQESAANQRAAQEQDAGATAAIAASRAPAAAPPLPAPAPDPSPAPAPAEAGPGGGSGSGFGGGAGGAASPAPSLASKVDSIPSGPQAVPTPAADGSQNSFANTEVGRNVTNTLSAVPGLGGVGRVAASGGSISNGLNAMSRLVNSTAAVGAGAAAAPSLAAAADSTPSITSTPITRPDAGQAADRSPMGDTVTSSAPQGGQVTRVGNSYSGGDVGGNISIGGDGPRGGGISAQNMSAAERLAGDSQAASMRRLGLDQGTTARSGGPGSGPVEPGSFTGGFTGVIGPTNMNGNMAARTPEQQRRDAEVSASSITNTRKWGGPDAANSASMLAYRDAVQQTSDIRQNEAGAAREAVRQSGENARARLTGQRYDDANQLDARRLALQETTAGFQNRQAGRVERAQEDFANASTPQAQATARERLMGLSGQRDSDWRIQVTPATKNPDGSSTEGSVYRINQRTGQAERVDTGRSAGANVSTQAQYDALPKGATYTGADGKTYRKPA